MRSEKGGGLAIKIDTGANYEYGTEWDTGFYLSIWDGGKSSITTVVFPIFRSIESQVCLVFFPFFWGGQYVRPLIGRPLIQIPESTKYSHSHWALDLKNVAGCRAG